MIFPTPGRVFFPSESFLFPPILFFLSEPVMTHFREFACPSQFFFSETSFSPMIAPGRPKVKYPFCVAFFGCRISFRNRTPQATLFARFSSPCCVRRRPCLSRPFFFFFPAPLWPAPCGFFFSSLTDKRLCSQAWLLVIS